MKGENTSLNDYKPYLKLACDEMNVQSLSFEVGDGRGTWLVTGKDGSKGKLFLVYSNSSNTLSFEHNGQSFPVEGNVNLETFAITVLGRVLGS